MSVVLEHMPLVRSVAGQVAAGAPASVQYDDLVQIGAIGLIEAVARYEPVPGVDFGAYARTRIRGAIIDGLREVDVVSRKTRSNLRRLEFSKRLLEHRLGRYPTESEASAEAGIPLKEYQAIVDADVFLTSYEEVLDVEGDSFASKGSDPVQHLLDRERLQRAVDAIATLPDRDRKVLTMIYDQDMKLKDIGQAMGLHETRIGQLHKEILRKLRTMLETADE